MRSLAFSASGCSPPRGAWFRFERAVNSHSLATRGPIFGLGALNVVTLQGNSIVQLTGFLDPAVHVRFGLPDR